MAFYQEMAEMVSDLLKPDSMGGLGQGKLVLSRITTTTPTNPWEVPEKIVKSETINGAVRGVDARLVGTQVGENVIAASDRVAVTEVPKMGYTAGDVFSVDGVPVMIIAVEKLPAAGVAAGYVFTIRG